ncbi:MAG: hypothetical protein ABII22_03150 [Candidatus Micrarchaeota archaeon]
MNKNDYVTLFLVVVLALLVALAYLKMEAETPVAPDVFAETLSASDTVFLVQDIRGAVEPARTNIMQCGVDFAGSPRFVDKKLVIFAFEGNDCYFLEGIGTVDNCLSQIKDFPMIHIKQGNMTQNVFYKTKAVVNVGAEYNKNDCSIR